MKYQFKTGKELLALCKKHKKSISEISILREMEFEHRDRKFIVGHMRKVRKTMEAAIKTGLHSSEKGFMGMSGGDAEKIHKMKRRPKGKRLMSKLNLRAMSYATATGETNAVMGRIAAFPTAGGAGVVPGVVFGFAHEYKLRSEKVMRGLFTAAAVGLIIAENATLSAAAAGCQAEVGAAMAMGTAAVTEMRGGTPEECLNASAIVLKSYLGVACDPLGGLVAVPCIKRNAIGCPSAFAASDLSMAGIDSYIPFDEVVTAMWEIGQLMSPKIKETALGGLAVTPTGLKVRKRLGLPDLKPTEAMIEFKTKKKKKKS
jgi:L-serine dehydratase